MHIIVMQILVFQEKGHIYDVNGDKTFTSVTKFVHGFAKPFNPVEVIAGISANEDFLPNMKV